MEANETELRARELDWLDVRCLEDGVRIEMRVRPDWSQIGFSVFGFLAAALPILSFMGRSKEESSGALGEFFLLMFGASAVVLIASAVILLLWGIAGRQVVVATKERLIVAWFIGTIPLPITLAVKRIEKFVVGPGRRTLFPLGKHKIERRGWLWFLEDDEFIGIQIRLVYGFNAHQIGAGLSRYEAEGVAALISQHTGIPWENTIEIERIAE